MARTFCTSITGELNKQYAGEPMLIVEVYWNNSSSVAYSDRKLNGADYPIPNLLQVGTFESTTVVDGGEGNQSTQITLNDSDGAIRDIIDNYDIHLRPVKIYLAFQGLPLDEKALMFEGLINSDIVWSEADRTLTFSVLTKLESADAGFAMEDGDFPYIPSGDRSKAWPLVFGQVCNMETVQVTALRRGYLAQGVGVPDPTIEDRLCQIRYVTCPIIYDTVQKTWMGTDTDEDRAQALCMLAWVKAVEAANNGAELAYSDDFCNNFKSQFWPNTRTGRADPHCVERRQTELCSLLYEKMFQESYLVNPMTIRGGENFPQGHTITIKAGDVKFTGIMTGESFAVSSIYHPDEEIENPECMETPSASLGWRYTPDNDYVPNTIEECNADGTYTKDVVDGSAASWEYYNSFQSGRFIWLPPGTEVTLDTEADLVHIVSLLPGTVDQVAAYKTYGDTSFLTELSTDMYTVHSENYGDYETVEIWLDTPLSSIEGVATWDDTLYVSFTSTIGPNPTDIIEWLIDKYTNYSIDPVSFAHVNTMLTNYPSNFFIKDRPSVFQLISDIAYQSRCAVYVRNNVIYIKYLSEEPASLRTITEDDIINGSFSFYHTQTESLETKHNITWSDGEAGVRESDDTEYTLTLKHNVPKYGTFEADYNYYTYNIDELVEKSATFWMIRKANTWRYVEFETVIKHLDLEIFDCVTLDIAQFPTTKIIIEETVYNADNNTIKFKAWTPIKSGSTSPYYWAWPSQQDADAIFPLSGATGESGDGTNLTVIPPEDHPLRSGYEEDQLYVSTDGDDHPSDLDDVLPTLTCKIATGAEISEAIEPEFQEYEAEELANKNFEERMKSTECGAEIEDDDEEDQDDDNREERPGPCGGTYAGQTRCFYEVNVTWVTPATVTTVQAPGMRCKKGGPCAAASNGMPCTGRLVTRCHSFGSLSAAQSFVRAMESDIQNRHDKCLYSTGTFAPYQTSGNITAIGAPAGGGDCEDPADAGDPDHPAADAGEIFKPKDVS